MKLERKAAQRDSSENGTDPSEDKGAGGNSDDEWVPKVENELADAKQQHKVTLEKLAAAEELAKNQSVSPTANS